MPLNLLKDRRWALLLSGVFIGSFIGNAVLFVWNEQMPSSFFTPVYQQFILAGTASFVLAYFFFKLAMEKRMMQNAKPKARRTRKRK